MKRFFILVTLLAAAVSCDLDSDEQDSREHGSYHSLSSLSHGMIRLGRKLDDPYTVENMSDALAKIYPTKAGSAKLKPTDIYVRVLPSSEKQYRWLERECGYVSDHPLDYEIVEEGDYYRDPDISEGEFTWQYVVVPKTFRFPADMRVELLDECYIPGNANPTKGGGGIDWDVVERESFRLTGNEHLLSGVGTKSGAKCPSGRIVLADKHYNGGEPVGLAGVKVCCNVFVKFSSAHTDDEGYYELGRKFSGKPRYRLIFSNTKGFNIGFNLVLVPASISTLGKASPEGINVIIDKDSDRQMFTRSVVNNAAYEYYNNCKSLSICTPPADLRIWILYGLDAGSAPMLHHGALVDNKTIKDFLGEYGAIVKMFLPDITIGAKGMDDYYMIYSEVVHELSHASHYAQVGNDFWNKYIFFVLYSYVKSGWVVYGTGTEPGAGFCEVGEMWAYFHENQMHMERYPGHDWNRGMKYWFKPQILSRMSERGIGKEKIFKALTPDVTSGQELKAKLLELYPESRIDIEQSFKRYSL